MTIYERIKSRRKELDLTAEEVAKALGVSRATIYRYESSEIEKLPITILEPLAKVLKTTPSYLMGWTDKQSDYEPKKEKLLSHFNSLNASGQDKAIDYVSDLSDNPKYQKEDCVREPDVPYMPEVLAAHRSAGEPTEADINDKENILKIVAEEKRKKGLL